MKSSVGPQGGSNEIDPFRPPGVAPRRPIKTMDRGFLCAAVSVICFAALVVDFVLFEKIETNMPPIVFGSVVVIGVLASATGALIANARWLRALNALIFVAYLASVIAFTAYICFYVLPLMAP